MELGDCGNDVCQYMSLFFEIEKGKMLHMSTLPFVGL